MHTCNFLCSSKSLIIFKSHAFALTPWRNTVYVLSKIFYTLRTTPYPLLTLPTIMLSNTSSSSEDMTITPLMAFLMSWRLCRITLVKRLNLINSWFKTVFIDSSYRTGNLFWRGGYKGFENWTGISFNIFIL